MDQQQKAPLSTSLTITMLALNLAFLSAVAYNHFVKLNKFLQIYISSLTVFFLNKKHDFSFFLFRKLLIYFSFCQYCIFITFHLLAFTDVSLCALTY